MTKFLIGLLGIIITFSAFSVERGGKGRKYKWGIRIPHVIDLTHTIPTFMPLDNDVTTPDLNLPWGDSKPVPTFEQQATLSTSTAEINEGYFDLGTLHLAEHHGTHLDAPYHFVNNLLSQEDTGIPQDELKMTHEIDAKELVGEIALIDISDRVQNELNKNDGVPSSDISVTDFSDSSPNVVNAQDIIAIKDEINDGIWLVLNLGWSQFFNTGEVDWVKSPYVNDWNHPGLTRGAVNELIKIMDRKKVKIAGIVTDNISIGSGESSKGGDDQLSSPWPAQIRLLQRQIMLVESAANLNQLTKAIVNDKNECLLVVGAIKHMRGTGAPARLLGLCQSRRGFGGWQKSKRWRIYH